MNPRNYQRELDMLIGRLKNENRTPTLFLHSCCAPCSSYVIEYLSDYFSITVFYYNPNIYPDEEYFHRSAEQQRLISELPVKHPVSFVEGDFDKQRFYGAVKGLEQLPEGGTRCEKCYALRLLETAKQAKTRGFDYFATTLTISPLKNARTINTIGEQIGEKYKVSYLCSDFKKKNGFKRSTELSAQYGMYRQNYCGCVFSQRREG